MANPIFKPDSSVLILGGTTEGYDLAQRLVNLGQYRVISSLAGRTANPRLPVGEVRIGGFGGVDGLRTYLVEHNIAVLIDATHPFASRMGWNAATAASQTTCALVRLERPAWTPTAEDNWDLVEDWSQAAHAVAQDGNRVLLTIGRQELEHFVGLDQQWFLIRSVDTPNPLPAFAHSEILLSRGPFKFEDERRLLIDQRIDTIVCKNSGGSATDAKLKAARELGIKVVMLQRPKRPETVRVTSCDEALDWLQSLGFNNQGP